MKTENPCYYCYIGTIGECVERCPTSKRIELDKLEKSYGLKKYLMGDVEVEYFCLYPNKLDI